MNLTQLIIILITIILLNSSWNILYADKSNKTSPQEKTGLVNFSSHSEKIAARSFFTFIALIPLLAGLWAVNHWFKEYNMARDSINWDVYKGTILSKLVSFHKAVNTTGSESSGKLYIPTVEYEFTYNNQTVKHDVIDLKNHPASGDISKSEAILDQLPDVGEHVDVYFSFDHKKAVLIPGHHNSSYFGVITGFFFLFIGLIALKFIYAL